MTTIPEPIALSEVVPLHFTMDDDHSFDLDIVAAEMMLERIEEQNPGATAEERIKLVRDWIKREQDVELTDAQAFALYYHVQNAYIELKKKLSPTPVSQPSTTSTPKAWHQRWWPFSIVTRRN